MVHLLHQEAVEVHKVAGHVKGCDLAPPISKEVVACGKARDESCTLGWTVSLPDHVLTLCHHSVPDHGLFKKLSLWVGKTVVLLELADEGRVQDATPLGGWLPKPISVAELVHEDEQRSVHPLPT